VGHIVIDHDADDRQAQTQRRQESDELNCDPSCTVATATRAPIWKGTRSTSSPTSKRTLFGCLSGMHDIWGIMSLVG